MNNEIPIYAIAKCNRCNAVLGDERPCPECRCPEYRWADPEAVLEKLCVAWRKRKKSK